MIAETESVSVLGPDYEHMTRMSSSGGMGELFRAHKRGLDVEVVVKRVKAQLHGAVSETREANILINLRHQFLPRIYDIISASDGFIYTVMDYIPGCNLQEYVERHGALSQAQSLKWLKQLCQVTAYLHQQKPPVLHCDIKPQNIMITPGGDICLIDFNTSLLFENTELNALGVTHGYAAPEQYSLTPQILAQLPRETQAARAAWSQAAAPYGKISERTDLYAIGAVGYFMLTGYAPAHSLGNVIPLSRYQIKLTDALREVLERAMRPNPKDRFPSAQAMYSALVNLKKADRRYRSWRVRCQITAVALGTLALVSLFCIWMGFDLRSQEQGGEYLQLVEQADALIQQQQYEESLDVLSEAIVLDDGRIEAYIRAGTVLYRLGRYSECIDLLSGLTFVYDDSAMSQQEFDYAQAELDYVLGSCYFQEEDYIEAVQNLELATWFAPDEPAYCRDLAIAQAMRGNLDEARGTYETLKTMSGVRQEDLLLVDGELSYASGQYEAALSPLLQLARGQDASLVGRSYLLAAQCYRHLGQLDQEISLLEEAGTVLDVSEGVPHMELLSEAYLQRGSAENSAEDFQRAYELCDSLIQRGIATLSVRLNAGLALQYLGQTDKALEVVQAVTADYPNDYRGYVRLALLYLDPKIADYTSAQSAYAQAEALYSGSGAQDGEMTYLASLMAELGLT